MKRIFKITFIVLALSAFFASCVKDLDTKPIDPDDQSPAAVFSNPASYKQVLAKLYAGLATSGQQGAAGNPDISGIDEGFGEYMRGFWYHQELTTDEAVIGWNDQTIKNFHYQTWGSSDVFIAAMYYRIFFQISQCNEFIRESTDSKLAEYGITNEADLANIRYYRAEARFLRALSYFHALDMFGNVPFVTENDPVGKIYPKQIQRADLYNYVESELLAIESLMVPARTNEYGRADQGAVWTLLAKLYLNAHVYIGQDKYTECITYCNKVISAGYTLEPDYQKLFLADNQNCTNEVIFSVNFDGLQTRTWGGTTFIIHAAVGGTMVPADYGVAGGWGGTRTTSALVDKFFPAGDGPAWQSKRPPRHPKAYTLLYVPGSYQGWDPANTTTVLASVANDGKFEGYLYFPDANAEFKFCKDPNWDTNWGDTGADGTLEPGGDNIKAADAGYYKINVDLNALTYTISKTTWGVIGDATPGGWDNDTPMTFDPADGMWKVTLDMTAAGMKFRANGNWDLNYGDTGADGILEAGGDNIAIGAAGTYEVKLKLGAPDYTYTITLTTPPVPDDLRAMFWTDGQSLEINDIGVFTDGYAITKFKNITSTGAAGLDGTYCDTDFPLMRFADVYLMYAEAVLRGGGGGDAGSALNYVNLVIARGHGNNTGANITADQLTLDFILDERARELFWEGYRRTDLIRYERFSASTYVWPWKGGVKEGLSTQSFYNLFPIPASDLSANYNLNQNFGY
jgi:hypothetical protein